MLVKRKIICTNSSCGIQQKNLNVNIKVTKINLTPILRFCEKEYYNKLLVKEKNVKVTWKLFYSL